MVDIHENVIRHIPADPNPDHSDTPEQNGADHDGPVYDGPVQVLGPGFAPFKPYLRPPFFYLRVSIYILSSMQYVYACYMTLYA